MKSTGLSLFIVHLLLIAAVTTADAGIIKRAGVKAALSTAGESYELVAVPGLQTDRRVGLGAAFFLEWFELPLLSVVTQVEYAQRGMKQTVNVTSPAGPDIIGQTTISNRLDYISIPVLLKARIGTPELMPYVLGGVRIDHLLGYHSDMGTFNPVYDSFDRTTVGGSVGAGVETDAILSLNLLAEVRYNFDFTDAYKTDLLHVSNNALDLWVGIAF
jgi:opacity protein-like surface antigen